MDEAREKEIRVMLSKLLNAPFKKKQQYDYSEQERIVFSWDEIFFELGRITERAKVINENGAERIIYRTNTDDMPKPPYKITC